MKSKRSFQDYSAEEKQIAVEAYLDGMSGVNDSKIEGKDLEWLRHHIPAYKDSSSNYIFISYSHKDYRKVYHDLAFFCYNSEKKVRFWYDEGLPAGDDWMDSVQKCLTNPECVGVIFYLSDSFLRSPSVLKEIELVKSLGKPYLTIALDENKICASDILTEKDDAEILNKVDGFFSRNITVLPYSEENEEMLYRVNKIEEKFNVTEAVFSDFICENTEGGLRLVAYNGNNTNVYIPERIGQDPIVEIAADFNNAIKIYIPYTVKRILPVIPPPSSFDIEDINTASLAGICEYSIGGYESPGYLLGKIPHLEQIEVDPRNPVFYDKDGVLFARNNTLVRVPPAHEWKDEYLEGIEIIGISAFYGYKNSKQTITLPSTVTEIGDHAFGNCSPFYLDIQNGVKKIGVAAFVDFSVPLLPITLPESVESIGEWAFRDSSMVLISFDSNCRIEQIPRGAFFGFSGEYISIPNSVKNIAPGAFSLCSNCDYFEIPDGVVSICHDAFFCCEKLYSIKIPRSIKYLSSSAFSGCDKLRYILYDASIHNYAIKTDADASEEDIVFLRSRIIRKDQPFKRLKARIQIKFREKAIKFVESKYGSIFQ